MDRNKLPPIATEDDIAEALLSLEKAGIVIISADSHEEAKEIYDEIDSKSQEVE